MEPKKIKVIRGFFYERTPQPVGAVLTVTAIEAATFVGANQAEYFVEEPAGIEEGFEPEPEPEIQEMKPDQETEDPGSTGSKKNKKGGISK